MKEHNREFVAVWEQKVVAADRDLEQMIAKTKQVLCTYPNGLYTRYISDRPPEMIL